MLAAYLINNYFDLDKDVLNLKANRPNLERKRTFIMCLLVNCLAVVLALTFSVNWALIVGGTAVILLGYAKYFSNLPLLGNFIVASLSSVVVLVFYVLGESFSWFMTHLYALAILIFIISLIREIIKDIEDIKGDKESGASTFPIMFGIAPSKVLVIALQLSTCFFLFSWAYYFFPNTSIPFLLSAAMVLVGLLFVGFIVLAKKNEQFKKLSLYYKIYMFCGVFLVPFLI